MHLFSSCSWCSLGRNRLQEKWDLLSVKIRKDIIDLSILALLAFTLQRYCGFPTCKAMLQLPLEILQPCG